MLWLYSNEGKSLSEIGVQFNLQRQSVHKRLQRAGYAPRPDSKRLSKLNDIILYNEKRYFKAKKGGWRTSIEPRITLHRQIWIDNFGEIPKGAMIYAKVQGSINIDDYFMRTKEERKEDLSKICNNHSNKPAVEGVVHCNPSGDYVKYKGKWMKKDRFEYLQSGGIIKEGQSVYNGVALDKDELFSVLRNGIPRELTKEGALLYQINKQLKKREAE